MTRHFTFEYGRDEGWFVGRLKQVPGVASQGRTLEELKKGTQNAYRTKSRRRQPGRPAQKDVHQPCG